MKPQRNIIGGVGSLFVILCIVCCVVISNPKSTTAPKEMPKNDYADKPIMTLVFPPSDTPTITPTSTSTPPPKTATAISKAYRQTATAKRYAWVKTATVEAKAEAATALAEYQLLAWQELINYPNNHHWENIKIHGVVFKINGNDMFQMYVGGYNPVVVETASNLSDLYPGAGVWVYGTVEGVTCSEGIPVCLTNSFGAQLYQPLLTYAFWSPG